MEEFTLATLIAGLFLLVCGYLVKVRKKLNLIAGYSAEAVADEDGLSEWVGSNLIYIALVVLSSSLFNHLFPSITLPLAITCAVVITALAAVTVRGCGKFLHGSAEEAERAQDARELQTQPRALYPRSVVDEAESFSVNSFARGDETPEPAPRTYGTGRDEGSS